MWRSGVDVEGWGCRSVSYLVVEDDHHRHGWHVLVRGVGLLQAVHWPCVPRPTVHRDPIRDILVKLVVVVASLVLHLLVRVPCLCERFRSNLPQQQASAGGGGGGEVFAERRAESKCRACIQKRKRSGRPALETADRGGGRGTNYCSLSSMTAWTHLRQSR